MESAQRSNRRIVLSAAVVAVVALLAVGGRALVADAIGGPLDALDAIPADVHGVFVADLAEFRELADSELMDYAIRLGQEAGDIPAGDPTDAYVDYIEKELRIDLEEDVLSWIGRSGAIGVRGDLATGDAELVVASFFVRDQDAAWRFVDLAVERTLEADDNATVSDLTVDGLRVIGLETPDTEGFLGVKGDFLVLADSRESLAESYDTIDTAESVVDTDWFRASNAELDRDAWFKVMIDPQFINDVYDEMAELVEGTDLEDLSALAALGMSLDLDGDQISMEIFVEQTEPLEADGFGPLALSALADLRMSPDLFMGFELPDDFGEQILEGLETADPQGLAELEAMSEDLLGVNSITDAVSQLGGHFFLSQAAGDSFDRDPLGDLEMAIGLREPGPVVDVFEALRRSLEADGTAVGGRDGLLLFPDDDVTAGVLGDEVVLRVEQSGRRNPFVDSDGYEWLETNFPGGAVLYVDIYSIAQSYQADAGVDQDFIDDLDAARLGATLHIGERNMRFSAILQMGFKEP